MSKTAKKSERMVEKIFDAEGITPKIGIAEVPPLKESTAGHKVACILEAAPA